MIPDKCQLPEIRCYLVRQSSKETSKQVCLYPRDLRQTKVTKAAIFLLILICLMLVLECFFCHIPYKIQFFCPFHNFSPNLSECNMSKQSIPSFFHVFCVKQEVHRNSAGLLKQVFRRVHLCFVFFKVTRCTIQN